MTIWIIGTARIRPLFLTNIRIASRQKLVIWPDDVFFFAPQNESTELHVAKERRPPGESMASLVDNQCEWTSNSNEVTIFNSHTHTVCIYIFIYTHAIYMHINICKCLCIYMEVSIDAGNATWMVYNGKSLRIGGNVPQF